MSLPNPLSAFLSLIKDTNTNGQCLSNCLATLFVLFEITVDSYLIL